MTIAQSPKLILGSGSPRRRDLLAQIAEKTSRIGERTLQRDKQDEIPRQSG